MPEVHGWKPQQYGGFSRGNWDVDFDGEYVEASVNVSGYGGYGDRVCLPLPMLRALLSRAGLAIVKASDVPSAEEREVLRAMAAMGLSTLQWYKGVSGGWTGPANAELARRAAKGVKP